MSKFTTDEVRAIVKHGGNKVAEEKWLARWNPQTFPKPEVSDGAKIREFIKECYIKESFKGDSDSPPMNGGGG